MAEQESGEPSRYEARFLVDREWGPAEPTPHVLDAFGGIPQLGEPVNDDDVPTCETTEDVIPAPNCGYMVEMTSNCDIKYRWSRGWKIQRPKPEEV